MKNGKLYIVATPIGNLDDMSIRAINTLKNVDLIIAEDTRHSLILLKHFDIHKPIDSYHKFNEQEKSSSIIQKLQNGTNIALISDAGTPGISDPGNILINHCINSNIDVVPIPGACAFVQALIVSGFETNQFSFYGFLPVNNKDRKIYLKKIYNDISEIIILYEAPHKLLKTLEDLQKTLGNVQICISKEITKIHENHFRTTIDNAIIYYKENAPKGEFVIVIKKNIMLEKEYSMVEKETQKIIMDRYLQEKEKNTLKEISKTLAQELNLSKNEIYNFLINRKK